MRFAYLIAIPSYAYLIKYDTLFQALPKTTLVFASDLLLKALLLYSSVYCIKIDRNNLFSNQIIDNVKMKHKTARACEMTNISGLLVKLSNCRVLNSGQLSSFNILSKAD